LKGEGNIAGPVSDIIYAASHDFHSASCQKRYGKVNNYYEESDI
jgi:hypothetical protein